MEDFLKRYRIVAHSLNEKTLNTCVSAIWMKKNPPRHVPSSFLVSPGIAAELVGFSKPKFFALFSGVFALPLLWLDEDASACNPCAAPAAAPTTSGLTLLGDSRLLVMLRRVDAVAVPTEPAEPTRPRFIIGEVVIDRIVREFIDRARDEVEPSVVLAFIRFVGLALAAFVSALSARVREEDFLLLVSLELRVLDFFILSELSLVDCFILPTSDFFFMRSIAGVLLIVILPSLPSFLPDFFFFFKTAVALVGFRTFVTRFKFFFLAFIFTLFCSVFIFYYDT